MMSEFKLKKGLGRGLSSLIGESSSKKNTFKVNIEDIVRNKFQPRKIFDKESLTELTNSIRERGVIQPIVVRPDQSKKNKYEIIAGERRWLASQNAGLHEVPVVVLDVSDERSLEFSIIENVQRQDLNPIEEAKGYKRLIDEFSYSQEKLSKFIGKSRSYIANSLRLLSLPSEIISHIENGRLSAGHARPLIGLGNSAEIAKKIIENKFSVRQAESLVKKFRDRKNIRLVLNKDVNISDLEKSLEEKTGLNVVIKNKKNNSGQLSFIYKSLDQLERIISVIKRNY